MAAKPLFVSEINTQVKSLLETTFVQVCVRGEISALTHHSSGHIYFTIKDEKSALDCMMFKGSASKGLKFRLEVGMDIVIYGAISVYVPRGSYKLNCFSIEPFGVGALSIAFEQLKSDLEKEGYFDRESKKEIPKYIDHIVLVTSSSGAALQDMLRVAQKRWPLIKITTINTLVQGEGAKESISKNIAIADSLGADLIVVARGGGSLEDLWAFNERVVAEAIYRAKTPIVSAIGHEVDMMISDFVADIRAPTPSAAMEMVLPDKSEVLIVLSEYIDRIDSALQRTLRQKEHQLKSLHESVNRYSIDARLERSKREIDELAKKYGSFFEIRLHSLGRGTRELFEKMDMIFLSNLNQKKSKISSLKESLESYNPKRRIKKGFAQVVKNQKVANLKEIKVGEEFLLEDIDMRILAKAMQKSKI